MARRLTTTSSMRRVGRGLVEAGLALSMVVALFLFLGMRMSGSSSQVEVTMGLSSSPWFELAYDRSGGDPSLLVWAGTGTGPTLAGQATFTPTGVLIPVESMSIRVLIGMIQALVRPGN